MKKILVAVTGGVSAYKSVDVISALKKSGYFVSVMATESALQFVTENILEITANKYWKHTWASPIHIEATDDIDGFIVVPATVNIIAKFAYGIADDLVSSTHMALPNKAIKIICPAANTRMWDNMIFQKNLTTLMDYKWQICYPSAGLLACGTIGMGKLPSTKDIVDFIKEKMEKV